MTAISDASIDVEALILDRYHQAFPVLTHGTSIVADEGKVVA